MKRTCLDNMIMSENLKQIDGFSHTLSLLLRKGFNFDETSISTTDQAVITWHRITEAFKHGSSVKYALGDNDVGSHDHKRDMEEVLKSFNGL